MRTYFIWFHSASLLRAHIDYIMMKYTAADNHVTKAKPQRTLANVTEKEMAGMLTDDLGMVTVAGSEEKRLWTFSNLWYNIPLDKN